MTNKINFYNKLIRDKLINKMIESGDEPFFFIANDDEFKYYLKKKILEEVDEFFLNPSAEEFGDILEVLDCIASTYNIDKIVVEHIKKEKLSLNGSFHNKIILKKVLRKN